MKDLIIKDTITDLSENDKNLILESFSPVVQALNDFGRQFPKIQAMEIGDEKCKKAKRFRIDFGKQITAADAVRKDLKEESLKKGKAIQAVFNYIKTATEGTKEAALEIETHFERLEAEKKERLQTEREAELLRYDVTETGGMDLGGMDDGVWSIMLTGSKANYEAAKDAERKAEEERLEALRIDSLGRERKDSVIDLWQFVPEENRDVNFGTWADDMWNELVNYLYLEKSNYDNEQKKIRQENEQLRIDAEAAESKRIADENKAEKKKRDRVKKYSKKLLESGYESRIHGVYVLGMYRVTDDNLESMTDKEFQDRLTECAKGHKRDLQLKKEREDAEAEKKKADEKKRLDKEKADQEAADKEAAAKAPDKEKLISIAQKLRNTKTTVKSDQAQQALEDAALLIEKIAKEM